MDSINEKIIICILGELKYVLLLFRESFLDGWKSLNQYRVVNNTELHPALLPIISYSTKHSVTLDMTECFYTIVVYLNR